MESDCDTGAERASACQCASRAESGGVGRSRAESGGSERSGGGRLVEEASHVASGARCIRAPGCISGLRRRISRMISARTEQPLPEPDLLRLLLLGMLRLLRPRAELRPAASRTAAARDTPASRSVGRFLVGRGPLSAEECAFCMFNRPGWVEGRPPLAQSGRYPSHKSHEHIRDSDHVTGGIGVTPGDSKVLWLLPPFLARARPVIEIIQWGRAD